MRLQSMTAAIFKRYTDKGFSFTDCTSFSIMRSLKPKRVFAFDKHFEQFEGISRRPVPPFEWEK